jgi:hypothetical protein
MTEVASDSENPLFPNASAGIQFLLISEGVECSVENNAMLRLFE